MVLKINIEKRYAYTIIILLAVLIGMWAVYAYGTNNPSSFGHDLGELEIGYVSKSVSGISTRLPFNAIGPSPQNWQTVGNLGNFLNGDIPETANVRVTLTALYVLGAGGPSGYSITSCPNIRVSFTDPDDATQAVTNIAELSYYPPQYIALTPAVAPYITSTDEVEVPVDDAGNIKFKIETVPTGPWAWTGQAFGCNQGISLYLTGYERRL